MAAGGIGCAAAEALRAAAAGARRRAERARLVEREARHVRRRHGREAHLAARLRDGRASRGGSGDRGSGSRRRRNGARRRRRATRRLNGGRGARLADESHRAHVRQGNRVAIA